MRGTAPILEQQRIFIDTAIVVIVAFEEASKLLLEIIYVKNLKIVEILHKVFCFL